MKRVILIMAMAFALSACGGGGGGGNTPPVQMPDNPTVSISPDELE